MVFYHPALPFSIMLHPVIRVEVNTGKTGFLVQALSYSPRWPRLLLASF
ncbi:hypothetical protein [Acinetobacter thutiue]|nr:hypothetical protein [Acinetobacter thutiue]